MQNTALLVMDMQAGILGAFPKAKEVTEAVNKAITTARNRNIPVIYVVVGFRPGMPEISANNKTFSASRERFAGANMEEWMKIHPDVLYNTADPIVTKRHVSAFAGSDLEVLLRAKDIRQMILTGVATSGVVLSTAREAADKDFQLTILADACADGDEEVHRVLTTKIFPRQADVLTVEEWSK